MRPFRLITLGILFAFLVHPLASVAQGPEMLIGTWKVNMAKSKASPGPLNKSQTSHWEKAPGGGFKSVVDTVDAAGKATHTELVTMFDGKAVEVKGATLPTTRTYTRIDDHSYQFVD